MANENDNRVLNRRNARVITTEEAQAVAGSLGPLPPGPHTNTACMFDKRVIAANGGKLVEDIGEC